MYYYEVLVSSPQLHGQEALTYQYDYDITIGTVVSVPMRARQQLGIVIGAVAQPAYKTKPITLLLTQQRLPQPLLELLSWLQLFYPAPLGLIAQQALPSGLLLAKAPAPPSQATSPKTSTPLPELSPTQRTVVDTIQRDPARRFLLHGDTGTGKTRVYMELVAQVVKNNTSALIITPEIGLTPQLVRSFETHFSEEVVVLHSHQSPAERRTQWLKILYSKLPQIIIGPRSALFAPISKLGLIVVDEAHDAALKQDKSPRYHALRVAAKLAQLHQAQFISGSATPLISEYWQAEQTHTPILRLNELPAGRKIERDIVTVSLKDRTHFSRNPYLSDQLLTAISTALQKKQQSLVFLNRRGTARLLLCQKCSWQAHCPRCDLPLTYHSDHHQIQCHTCGYHAVPPNSCPECSSHDIIFRSIGTKALTSALEKLFPQARIKRYDTDNTKEDRIEQHYAGIAKGDVDIIVGTQMITKGLDLPLLSVVGVVLADTSLYLPDFSAEEQTYQMLTQVIGRVGRGHTSGTVVVQSYQPENTSIQAAIKGDWSNFYDTQLQERETFGFPPFYHFLKLTIGRSTSSSAESAAIKLRELIKSAGHRVVIVGPSPAFREKVNGKFHWQLLVKSKDRRELTAIITTLPSGWMYDIDPVSLL